MTLLGNGRHDCNCANPRNLIAFLMIIVKSQLLYFIVMKNPVGYSWSNSTERPIDSIAFRFQSLC